MIKVASGLTMVVLCLWLSGCAHSLRTSTRSRVPDWEAEDVAPIKPAPTQAEPQKTEASRSNSQPITSSERSVETPSRSVPSNVASSGPQPPDKKKVWVPLNWWCKEFGLPAPIKVATSSGQTVEVRGTNGIFFAHPGSRLALWEGVELRLGFAPILIDNQVFLHTLDLSSTVQPLLFPPPHSLSRPAVVIIDPGHGGENAGTRSAVSRQFEKEFTLDWARRLAALLQAKGFAVFLTRNNDSNLALSNRVAFADAHRADAFISLHFNSAGPADNESGLETYCLTPAGMPSTVTRGFNDETDTAFPNNSWDAQNLQLAYEVHQALLHATGTHDRGVRRARFPGVLRNQSRPAILVEGGYLSNPTEARRIGEPQFRQTLAEAVAAGIQNFFKQGTAAP